MISLLRVGLFMMVALLPVALRAQPLDATDTAEIQQKALRHVQQFESLLNVISQSDEYFRKYNFDQLIRNYYRESSSYQIFRDSLVVIEDDLNPKTGAQGYGNLLTIKDYLKAFFSLYEKSPPPSVVFTNYEVSEVEREEFLYVEVYYESKFRNKHRAYPDLPYPVRHRRATVKAEPQNGGWRVIITDIGYAQPERRPPPVAAFDSATTSAPVAAIRQAEEGIAEPPVRPDMAENKPAVHETAPPDTAAVATVTLGNAFDTMRRVYRQGKTYPLPVQVNPASPPTSLMLYQGTEVVRDFSGSLADPLVAWQVPQTLATGDNYQWRLYDPVSEEVIRSSTFAIKGKARWPWIVGGVGAAAVIYAIMSSGGGGSKGDDELPAPPFPE